MGQEVTKAKNQVEDLQYREIGALHDTITHVTLQLTNAEDKLEAASKRHDWEERVISKR